jgi:hypothetical protein
MKEWTIEAISSVKAVWDDMAESKPYAAFMESTWTVFSKIWIVLFQEFHIPIEIIPPILWYFPKTYSNPDGWNPGRTFRLTDKLHRGFGGDTPSLFSVTVDAACYNVLPFCSSSTRLGHDMVIGKFFSGTLISAILTPVPVSCIDALPWEFDRCLGSFDHIEQTDHRRQLEGKTHRAYFAAILLDHLYLSETKQSDRLLPIDDFQWLISNV